MRIIYYLFAAGVTGFLLMANATGPGNVQGADRTGGPLSAGACTVCHGTANFDPSLDVKVLSDGAEVNGYEAGETYTLRVTVNNNGGSEFGFQATALSADDSSVGSFTASSGTQIITLNGVDYIEHSSPSGSNTFEVEWTAPSSGAGEVNFYAAGVAANAGGTNGGDGADFLMNPVVLADMTVGTNDLPELAADLLVFPNPVQDQLNVELTVEATLEAEARLVNTAGQVLYRHQQIFQQGQNEWSINVQDLPAGHYWLELSDGQSASRTAVLKQ